MDVLLVITTLVFFVLTLYYYFTRTFNYWKSRNVPGPKPVVFFGNLLELTLRKKHGCLVYKDIYDKYPNEKVVGVYRMTTPCLLLRDLDVIKQVMIKDFDYFQDRGVEFSKEGLGLNLFHADGESWRVLRSKLTPIFTSGKLKNMFYLISQHGDKFADYIQQLCEQGTEHEIQCLIRQYTVSTISACAFGRDVDIYRGEMKELNKIDKLIFENSYVNELDMMYPGLLKKLNASLLPNELTHFFYNLVKTILTQRNGKPSNKKDFMDVLLELRMQDVVMGPKRDKEGKQTSMEITDSVMAAQAFVFYAGGYETSATTMSFMLYELAKNPEIQEKLIKEIDEVLKETNGEVTYESLKKMTYLSKVFDETLRMYPIGDLQRNVNVDYQLPGTNVTLKKGQTVLISPISIHHDPQYYPDPEKFDPERFSPDIAGSRHPCAYLPFGLGPRNCIGMRFAKVQSGVCIAKFLSRFRVATCKNTVKNIDVSPNYIVLRAISGITLNVIPRKLIAPSTTHQHI